MFKKKHILFENGFEERFWEWIFQEAFGLKAESQAYIDFGWALTYNVFEHIWEWIFQEAFGLKAESQAYIDFGWALTYTTP